MKHKKTEPSKLAKILPQSWRKKMANKSKPNQDRASKRKLEQARASKIKRDQARASKIKPEQAILILQNAWAAVFSG